MEDYTSALFLDGQFSHAYYSRGTLLRDSGQHLFALADFDKAIRYNYPDPARVHLGEALTFEKLGRPSDARNALKRALAANPDYEPARQRLAVLDGTAAPKLQLASADQLPTAATTPAAKLPAAQPPSVELMLGSAQAETEVVAQTEGYKKIVDRVPVETAAIVPAAAPAAAAEKVIEVEEVPPETTEATDQQPVETSVIAGEVATEAPPSTGSAVDAASLKGWSVQVASAASEDAAWSVWKKMKARHKALASRDPVVVRADLGTKGVFYRVRFVYDSQQDASGACSKLKSRGVKCYVSKASS
jgi:hypothetical protein